MERAHVLIVDDLPEKLLAHCAVLETIDADLITARSGDEALKRVLHEDFAVILLDVNMPDIDGLETATLIRRYKRSRHTPIIFVTAYADEMQTSRGYELGAVDYILSPVIPEVLRTKVQAFVDLYQAQAGLAEANQVLEQRVAERTGELQASLEREKVLRTQAEELSRLKDEFLATMSHELRTPLNAIFGWITLLRTRRLDAATQERALETIERNARAQKRLIEDLLDVSRIVTGKVTLEVTAIDLRRVITAAVSSMLPAAQAKSIELATLLDSESNVFRGDFARLQQVVCNLLSNAIKFTMRGGRIEVRLQRQGDVAELTVADSGQGIKPEFLPHVFDRFRQEDGTISRRHGGLSLGLAIVRYLIEMHGGTVEAASDGEGQGATFTIRLPVREADGDVEPVAQSPTAGMRGTQLEGLHVLVVDDDPGARELLANMLQGYGARVSLASSGPVALTLLFEQRPHVVLADIGMPDMDGYALIEQVRALDPHLGGRIPAVAVTAHASA